LSPALFTRSFDRFTPPTKHLPKNRHVAPAILLYQFWWLLVVFCKEIYLKK